MNGTPRHTLQITPTPVARTRKQTRATSRRSRRPGKTQPAPRPEGQSPAHPGHDAGPGRLPGRPVAAGRSRQLAAAGRPAAAGQRGRPRKKPAAALHSRTRRSGFQGRPRKPGMEQIARLAVSAVTALAQLLNAIHRIRTGHSAS